MKINVLGKIPRLSLPVGLAGLCLAFVWLLLMEAQLAVATAPIGGDPISTDTAITILTTSDAISVVAAADLDNNGHIDLILGEGNNVYIVSNQSTTATISWASSVLVTSTSDSVADLVVADFDRDGLVDLAVATANSSGIGELALLRNPSSPFSTSWLQTTGLTTGVQLSLTTIAVGDLDGDGAPDLVSAGSDGVIRLWHNPMTDTRNFTTAWASPATISTGDGEINEIALADIDHDGYLDIAVVTGESTPRLCIWRNPNTPFTSVWTTSNLLASLSDDGISLSVVDFDVDSAPDIAVGLADGSVLAWHNPLTTTPFDNSWGTAITIENGTDPVNTLLAADLDQDGYVELIRGTGGLSPSLLIWHSQQKPFTGVWQSHLCGTTGRSIYSLATADFNFDGDLDIVSGDSGALLHWPNTLIHRNSPFSDHIDVGSQGTIQTMVVGDLDRDGRADLVTVNSTGYVNLWRNNGAPFSSGWPCVSWLSVHQIRSLTLADLDHDGYLDMITGHAHDHSEVRVWHNDGTPFDGVVWDDNVIGYVPHANYTDTWAKALAAGDLDGDGAIDIVAGTGSDFGTDITAWLTRSVDFGVYAWRNDGDPFGSTGWSSSTISVTLDAVNSVSLGDLDNDGLLDIVAGTNHPPSIGTITNPLTSTWPNAYSLRAFQNNGAPFISTWSDFNIGRDTETYTFAGGPIYHGFYGDSTYDVVLADLDNDGDLDIANCAGWEADYQIKVWENDGTPFDGNLWEFSATGLGPWWESDEWPWLSAGAKSLTAADINQDGWIDLVSGLMETPIRVAGLIYWENNGVPFSVVPTDTHWIRHDIGIPVTIFAPVEAVVSADLDNDGDPDLVTALSYSGGPSIYAWQNQGGAASEYPVGTAPDTMMEDTRAALVRVDVTHNGKWSDNDIELAWWRLTLTDASDTPMTGEQAANLFQDIRVYLDDGDDSWQSASDTLVISVTVDSATVGSGGLLTITFPASDPLTTLSIDEQATYFIVATLKSDASVHEPASFQMLFDPDAASLIRDKITNSSVSIQDSEPVTAGLVSILAGPPANMNVTASTSEVAADGNNTVVITTTVTNIRDNPVDDGTVVTLTTSLGSFPSTPYTRTTTNGVAVATLTTGTELGTAVITATAGTVISNTTVQFVAGDPDRITLTSAPTTIVANGSSTSIITATVFDTVNHPVADGTVLTFTTDLGSFPSTPYTRTTTNGLAIAVLTADTRAGVATLTIYAVDVVSHTTVQFIPGELYTITMTPEPDNIAVGGQTSAIRASVRDEYSNPVADGTVVTFTTSLGSFPLTPYTATTTSGVATAILTSGSTVGQAIITGDAGPAQDQTTVQFTPEQSDIVTVEASPSSIAVGGQTSTITATVQDEYGNPIADGTVVTFTTSLGYFPLTPYTATTTGGVATAELTSSTGLGTAVITATAGSVWSNTAVQFVVGPLAQIHVVAQCNELEADGTSTSVITSTLTDQVGYLITETVTVHFDTSLGSVSHSIKTTTNGVVTVTLQAPTQTGTATISAWVDSITGQTTVTFTEWSPDLPKYKIYLPIVIRNG